MLFQKIKFLWTFQNLQYSWRPACAVRVINSVILRHQQTKQKQQRCLSLFDYFLGIRLILIRKAWQFKALLSENINKLIGLHHLNLPIFIYLFKMIEYWSSRFSSLSFKPYHDLIREQDSILSHDLWCHQFSSFLACKRRLVVCW